MKRLPLFLLAFLLCFHVGSADEVIVLDDCPFPAPRSCPEERSALCNKPRLCKFVIPAGVAAMGLAIGAIAATDKCPSPAGYPPPVLNFFVEGSTGSESPGNISFVILFPDGSALDSFAFSSDAAENYSATSNSTVAFESGDSFSLQVTASGGARNVNATLRIDGVPIETQSLIQPDVGDSLIFTTP